MSTADYSQLTSDDLLPDSLFPREIKLWLRDTLLNLQEAQGHANLELRIQFGHIVVYKEQYAYKVGKKSIPKSSIKRVETRYATQSNFEK